MTHSPIQPADIPEATNPQALPFYQPALQINLGCQIVTECLKAKQTRKEFVRKLGLSPKTVWNWQTGRRRPSEALLRRISKLRDSHEDQ